MFHASKTAKMIKVILLRAPCQNVNVLLSDITFIIFFCFRCVKQCRSPLTEVFFYYICCFFLYFQVILSILKVVWNTQRVTNKKAGHVTSSVTWPLDSRWYISYWWSFGPKSLSQTVSEIFRPKQNVLIDTMLNRHCACAYRVTCTTCVKFKYIFQFLTPTLPIHSVTFIELRWRIRGVLSVTSNVKGQIISKSKNLQNFDFLGALEIRGYEKLRFLLQKAHPCVNPRRLSHFAWKSVG